VVEVKDKVPKTVVHYRAGIDARRCECCTMFRKPRRCVAVEGDIAPMGLCDLFKRKTLSLKDVKR